MYLAHQVCQFLSWLHCVPEEADYTTAEGFACVKPVVQTREYSSKAPCLARIEGDWPLGSGSTLGSAQVRGLRPGLCQVQRAQGLEGRLCSARLWGCCRHEDFLDHGVRDRTWNYRGKKGSSAGNCFLSIPSNSITSQLESIYAFFVYET